MKSFNIWKVLALISLGVIALIFGVAGACGGIVAATTLVQSWSDPSGVSIALMAALVCIVGLGIFAVCVYAMKSIRGNPDE